MNCGCTKSWLKLTPKQALYYETDRIKTCRNGHHSYPYFVHDEDGDYYGLKEFCKKEASGKILYFCVKCKNCLE